MAGAAAGGNQEPDSTWVSRGWRGPVPLSQLLLLPRAGSEVEQLGLEPAPIGGAGSQAAACAQIRHHEFKRPTAAIGRPFVCVPRPYEVTCPPRLAQAANSSDTKAARPPAPPEANRSPHRPAPAPLAGRAPLWPCPSSRTPPLAALRRGPSRHGPALDGARPQPRGPELRPRLPGAPRRWAARPLRPSRPSSAPPRRRTRRPAEAPLEERNLYFRGPAPGDAAKVLLP